MQLNNVMPTLKSNAIHKGIKNCSFWEKQSKKNPPKGLLNIPTRSKVSYIPIRVGAVPTKIYNTQTNLQAIKEGDLCEGSLCFQQKNLFA